METGSTNLRRTLNDICRCSQLYSISIPAEPSPWYWGPARAPAAPTGSDGEEQPDINIGRQRKTLNMLRVPSCPASHLPLLSLVPRPIRCRGRSFRGDVCLLACPSFYLYNFLPAWIAHSLRRLFSYFLPSCPSRIWSTCRRRLLRLMPGKLSLRNEFRINYSFGTGVTRFRRHRHRKEPHRWWMEMSRITVWAKNASGCKTGFGWEKSVSLTPAANGKALIVTALAATTSAAPLPFSSSCSSTVSVRCLVGASARFLL